jgi:glycine/D-amino acid oxidase-like deaminating enzyme
VLVIGGGLVGLASAWLLQRRGHRVSLLDPGSSAPSGPGQPQVDRRSGSLAALGVLMGQVFHRSTGRGWRLRQRSLELWRSWRQELEGRGHPIPYRPGLLLLAADGEELNRQRRLVEERQLQGLPLRIWEQEQLACLSPALPGAAAGGLYSPADGQLDPAAALEALRLDATVSGLTPLEGRALDLRPSGGGWRVALAVGGTAEAEWVVLAAGMGSAALLRSAGREQAMEPVLGQALELELAAPLDWNWPGAVVWRGSNLVPRPDLAGGRRLWLGATLEPGIQADPASLAALRNLGGAAPAWLEQAREVGRWQGIRPRPVGRPAPLLEQVAPGLLLAAGHHRNGVLLAPASAAWVAAAVEGHPGESSSEMVGPQPPLDGIPPANF